MPPNPAHSRPLSLLLLLLLLFPITHSANASSSPPPPPPHPTTPTPSTSTSTPSTPRLFAVWYEEFPFLPHDLPALRGGQAVVQWADVHPAPNRFNFSLLDRAVEAALAGLPDTSSPPPAVTVQVNGNLHPRWLFDRVPYTPRNSSWGHENQDPCPQPPPSLRGRASYPPSTVGCVLQFWHPNFVAATQELLAALGSHLLDASYRHQLLGLRQNFNAVGTEGFSVPPAKRLPAAWLLPPNITSGPPFTQDVEEGFLRSVISAHLRAFPPLTAASSPSVKLLLRTDLPPTVWDMPVPVPTSPSNTTVEGLVETGSVGLFHTSGEMEPRPGQGIAKYLRFLDHCPHTTCYCEPWADAWGQHGDLTDPRWCPPPQWFYWRLLSDLMLGIDNLALYAANLLVADKGLHPPPSPGPPQAVGTDFQAEFRAAFDFAATYVGAAKDPASSPGAWVAMRESISPGLSSYPISDYAFLMETISSANTTIGLDARTAGTRAPVQPNRTIPNLFSIGPYNQRYGAWARALRKGVPVQYSLHPVFHQTLVKGGSAQLLVVALVADPAGSSTQPTTTLEWTAFGQRGEWTGLCSALPPAATSCTWAALTANVIIPTPGSTPTIQLLAPSGFATLHMLEVRAGPSPSPSPSPARLLLTPSAHIDTAPTLVYDFYASHCPRLPQPGCVLDIERGCDCDIADAPVRAWWNGSATTMLASVDLGSRYMAGPSLTQLEHECFPYANSTNDMRMSQFADHEWVHSSWYFPGNNTVYALTHNEYHCDRPGCPVWPNPPPSLFFQTGVTLMASLDGGRSWVHARPPPAHAVAIPPYTWNATIGGQVRMGYRSPSSIVQSRAGDGFFYATITAGWGQDFLGQQAGACMMRTRDLTDPQAWRAWGGQDFNISLAANAWIDPSVQPAHHRCQPFTNTTYGTLVWSSHYRRYLYFGTADGNDHGGWSFALSDDLVHWDSWTSVVVSGFNAAGNASITAPPAGAPMPGRFIQRMTDSQGGIWWEDPTQTVKRPVGTCEPCPGIYACGAGNFTRIPDAAFDALQNATLFQCQDVGFKAEGYGAYYYPTLIDPSAAPARPNYDEVGQDALLFLVGEACAAAASCGGGAPTQLCCSPFDQNGLLVRNLVKVPVHFD